MSTINKVVVVGGGTMGCAVAAIFCAAGWAAHVIETNEAVRRALRGRIDAASRVIGADGSDTSQCHLARAANP